MQFHFQSLKKYTQQKTYQKSEPLFANKYAYKDENIVDVELNVQYTISDLKKYALNVEDPEITIRQATESALRHVVVKMLWMIF